MHQSKYVYTMVSVISSNIHRRFSNSVLWSDKNPPHALFVVIHNLTGATLHTETSSLECIHLSTLPVQPTNDSLCRVALAHSFWPILCAYAGKFPQCYSYALYTVCIYQRYLPIDPSCIRIEEHIFSYASTVVDGQPTIQERLESQSIYEFEWSSPPPLANGFVPQRDNHRSMTFLHPRLVCDIFVCWIDVLETDISYNSRHTAPSRDQTIYSGAIRKVQVGIPKHLSTLSNGPCPYHEYILTVG